MSRDPFRPQRAGPAEDRWEDVGELHRLRHDRGGHAVEAVHHERDVQHSSAESGVVQVQAAFTEELPMVGGDDGHQALGGPGLRQLLEREAQLRVGRADAAEVHLPQERQVGIPRAADAELIGDAGDARRGSGRT